MINDLTNNKLQGGVGDAVDTSQIDPTQLSLGITIEMEHTNDPKIAQEIATDHLAEDPAYYTKLIKAGLAKEYQPSHNSGFGDPDQSFNDPARLGNNVRGNDVTCTAGNNMVGRIGNTPDGHVNGRNSSPIINKTIDIELESKRKIQPTNPKLWSSVKSMAKKKFKVYPSKYANLWAARVYKKKGGGWKKIKESYKSTPTSAQESPFPAQVSPDGQGTFSSGYDFVGFGENFKQNNTTSNMKKEQLKEILKKLIMEEMEKSGEEEIEPIQPVGDAESPKNEPEMPESPEVSSSEENVTLVLDKETAQKLHQMLMQQLKDDDSEEETHGDEEISDDTEISSEEAPEEESGEESMDEGKKKKWIQKAIKKPGALHKQLGVAKGEKIPVAKLKVAAEKGGKLGKRARLALTLKKVKSKK